MRLMLALAAVLLATPALAAEDEAQTTAAADAPVVTGTPAKSAISTADQIDAFIHSSPAVLDAASDDVNGVTAGDDRRVHGEVSIGVGTHGYRSFYARSDMPVGETGRLSIAVEDSRGGGIGRSYYGGPYGGGFGGYGRGGSQSVGIGLSFSPADATDRQRCDLEGVTPPRPLDATGGPNGRCVRLGRGW